MNLNYLLDLYFVKFTITIYTVLFDLTSQMPPSLPIIVLPKKKMWDICCADMGYISYGFLTFFLAKCLSH